MAKAKVSVEQVIAQVKGKFGKVSIGENSISIPMSIARSELGKSPARTADLCFVAKRLRCNFELDRGVGDGEGDQQPLPGMEDQALEFSAAAESKTVSLKRRAVSITMNVMLSDVDVELVSHFANRPGILQIVTSEELPEQKRGRKPADAGDDEGDDEE